MGIKELLSTPKEKWIEALKETFITPAFVIMAASIVFLAIVDSHVSRANIPVVDQVIIILVASLFTFFSILFFILYMRIAEIRRMIEHAR